MPACRYYTSMRKSSIRAAAAFLSKMFAAGQPPRHKINNRCVRAGVKPAVRVVDVDVGLAEL